ncbi:MAG: DUF2961 domain-containing protein [Verrucomicrobiales bacterium]|nr:DUF2961 domain-containing protein [Verrucomicrobiales bacterium]
MGWLLGALTVSTLSAAETLTYPDLVRRLTDLERLAVLPADGARTLLESSYDRASKYDAGRDEYIKWDANDDGRGLVRDEGDRVVLAELRGPGVIWRLWSATIGSGQVRIYLDDDPLPVLDLPFRDYFSAKVFPWPNLVYPECAPARGLTPNAPGANNFVPLPFNKSCRIVGDKEVKDAAGKVTKPGWGMYFQATYTLFPPGTTLPQFQWPLSAADRAALDTANELLGKCGENPAPARAGQTTEGKTLTVTGGGRATVGEFTGSGAITGLRVKLALPREPLAARTLLRELTVSVTWDDDREPAVWAPLGDFFGVIGGAAPFRTLTAGLLEDGTLYAYWYMPFGRGAKIEVGNDGPLPVTMQWELDRAPLTVDIGKLGRFHAKWHRDAFLPERADRKIDWPLLVTRGRGRYVGTMLHVWNPRGKWWGEGDEKFFVDGEKFPSTFGTGSEDYFGYAWCSAQRFARPLHAQPLNEANTGNIDNLRWHVADDVPFQQQFEAAIEKYFPNHNAANAGYGEQALYAAVAYWYLAAGGDDPYRPLPVTERVGYFTPPVADYNEPGAIEGESLVWEKPPVPARLPETREMWLRYMWIPSSASGFQRGVWSNDRALQWSTGQTPGLEYALLKLPVTVSGKYRVIARFAKSENGGTFQLSLDGEKLGAPQDLWAPAQEAAPPVDLGVVTLSAGEHTLRVDLAGENEKVTRVQRSGLFFVLDYLKLEPAR